MSPTVHLTEEKPEAMDGNHLPGAAGGGEGGSLARMRLNGL